MTVQELSKDQKQELKQKYLSEKEDKCLSYDEMFNIDELVSDEEIFDEYEGITFVMDDFFCTAGQEEMSEPELLVSILNHIYEQKGGDVSETGFGYSLDKNNNPIYLMANGDSFKDGLTDLWNMIKEY